MSWNLKRVHPWLSQFSSRNLSQENHQTCSPRSVNMDASPRERKDCKIQQILESPETPNKTGISEVSAQLSRSVVSDSVTHGLQHARLTCPSPTLRARSDSWPSSWWCHPTNLSSVVPFSSRPQSFPASGSFPVISSFFLELFVHSSPVAYSAPTHLRSLSMKYTERNSHVAE